MRNRESRRVEVGGAEEQDVDVDEARAFGLGALAAHGFLDRENPRQELARDQLGANRNCNS